MSRYEDEKLRELKEFLGGLSEEELIEINKAQEALEKEAEIYEDNLPETDTMSYEDWCNIMDRNKIFELPVDDEDDEEELIMREEERLSRERKEREEIEEAKRREEERLDDFIYNATVIW